jgi:hypothetical protein
MSIKKCKNTYSQKLTKKNSTTNVIHSINLRPLPMAMLQQTCLHQWLLTAEAQLQTHVTPCGIYDRQSATGEDFYTEISASTCQFVLHHFSILHHHGFIGKRGPSDTAV